MTLTPTDRRLLAALAVILARLDPIPAHVQVAAEAAGRYVQRAPRVAGHYLGLAWAVPVSQLV